MYMRMEQDIVALAKDRYVHHFEFMKQGNVLGGALSTGMGAAFTGERVYVGIVTKKKGTGSKAHYHLDETFNYVLNGALKVVMDGEEFIVPTGALLDFTLAHARAQGVQVGALEHEASVPGLVEEFVGRHRAQPVAGWRGFRA